MDILRTTIDSVSVYRSGAEVVRRGTAELSEGTHKLYVTGMSGSARYDTVRLFGAEGLRCSNQRFEAFGEHQDEKESEKIRRKMEDIDRQMEVRQMQIDMWRSNGDFTARTAQSASEVEEYIEKLPERIEKLNGMISELRKQKEELAKEAEKAEEAERNTAVVVDVEVGKAGSYPFELRYYENSAEWTPVYELYSDGENPLEIRMRARISEHTGEDWENVQVSLFTGNPSSGSVLPELGTVYLDYRQEVRSRGTAAYGKSAPMMNMMMASAMADDAAEMPEESVDMEEAFTDARSVRMQTAEADVSDDDTMTEYVLPGRRDILDNYDGTMADLQSYQVPAEYEVAAAPILDPKAYLTARVKTSDIPFTSAFSAGVYLREKYLCSVYVDPDLTKDDIVITLGEDERIKVSRKEVSRKAANTFLKGLRTVDYGFETRITNISGKDMAVFLKDQVPVSREKDITVDVKELSGLKLEEKTGIVSGSVNVPAGQTVTSALAYKVSWPKDKRISESRSYSGRRFCPVCGAEVFGRFCPECGSVVN